MLLVLNEGIPSPSVLWAVVHRKVGSVAVSMRMMMVVVWKAALGESNASSLVLWNVMTDIKPNVVVIDAKAKS